MNQDNLRIGDKVVIITLGNPPEGEPNVECKIINETKLHWIVDVSHVEKGSNSWLGKWDEKKDNHIFPDTLKFLKRTGYMSGSGTEYEASRYCAPYMRKDQK